jgi:hypothetical protein
MEPDFFHPAGLVFKLGDRMILLLPTGWGKDFMA